IEDAAQAHLSSQEGKMAGSFGICGCFSFFPGKNLGAFGDAGMVVTGNEKLAEKIGMLRDHGRKEKYVHEIAGFNERMDAIQAAVLRVKFRYLEEWNQKRRQKAERYDNSLRDVVSPIKREKNNNPIYHLYVIKTERRQELRDFLQKNKIETGIHYPVPLHLQPAFKFLCYKKGDFPVSEKLSETALSLPIFPEMTEEQQEFVIQKIYEFFR
ncbi:MAG: DegT/DnrJ/EryC1/StrS family aminotransferase, partial [Elusimicrobiota bacterium]